MIADVTVVRSGRRTYRITFDTVQELARATHSVTYEGNPAGWPERQPGEAPAKVQMLVMTTARPRPRRTLRQLAMFAMETPDG